MSRVSDASSLSVTWTRSSRSGGNNNCLEVAIANPGGVYVRDSKRPAGPALVIPSRAWTAFLAGRFEAEVGGVLSEAEA